MKNHTASLECAIPRAVKVCFFPEATDDRCIIWARPDVCSEFYSSRRREPYQRSVCYYDTALFLQHGWKSLVLFSTQTDDNGNAMLPKKL